VREVVPARISDASTARPIRRPTLIDASGVTHSRRASVDSTPIEHSNHDVPGDASFTKSRDLSSGVRPDVADAHIPRLPNPIARSISREILTPSPSRFDLLDAVLEACSIAAFGNDRCGLQVTVDSIAMLVTWRFLCLVSKRFGVLSHLFPCRCLKKRADFEYLATWPSSFDSAHARGVRGSASVFLTFNDE